MSWPNLPQRDGSFFFPVGSQKRRVTLRLILKTDSQFPFAMITNKEKRDRKAIKKAFQEWSLMYSELALIAQGNVRLSPEEIAELQTRLLQKGLQETPNR